MVFGAFSFLSTVISNFNDDTMNFTTVDQTLNNATNQINFTNIDDDMGYRDFSPKKVNMINMLKMLLMILEKWY